MQLLCIKNNCQSSVKRGDLSTIFTIKCLNQSFPATEAIVWKLSHIDGSIVEQISLNSYATYYDKNSTISLSQEAIVKLGMYELSVTAQQLTGGSATLSTKFNRQPPPYGGICTVLPNRGMASKTLFVFFCSNWWDGSQTNDMLTFEFSMAIDYDRQTRLGKLSGIAGAAGMSTALPNGNKNNNYQLNVIFTVWDQYQQFTCVNKTITVQPTQDMEILMNLAVQLLSQQSTVSLYQSLNNLQQVQSALLSPVDSQLSNDTLQYICDSLYTGLTNLKAPEDLNSIKDLSIVMANNLKIGCTFTPAQMSNFSRLVFGGGSNMFQQFVTVDNIDTVKPILTSLMTMIAFQQQDFLETSQNIDVVQIQKQFITILYSVIGTLQDVISIGETFQHTSNTISLFIRKDIAQTIAETVVSTDDSTVYFADDLQVTPEDSNVCLIFKSLTFPFNPFTWGTGGQNISSVVVDCAVYLCAADNSSGISKRAFTSLKQYVTKMLIEKTKPQPVFSPAFHVNLSHPGEMTLIKLNLSSTLNAVEILFIPLDNRSLYVYVSLDDIVSENNYTHLYEVEEDNATIIINRTELFNTNAKHIYIGVKEACENDMCIETELKFQYFMTEYMCETWNEAQETWDDTSCTTFAVIRNKLTNNVRRFGALGTRFSTKINTINFHTVFSNFAAKLFGIKIVTSVLICVTLFFTVLLLYMRRLDKMDHLQWQIKDAPGNDVANTYEYELHIHCSKVVNIDEDCFITVSLHGSNSTSGERRLRASDYNALQNGGIIGLLVTTRNLLRDIHTITVMLERGHSPVSWTLKAVIVLDLQVLDWYLFNCYTTMVVTNIAVNYTFMEESLVKRTYHPRFEQSMMKRNLSNAFMEWNNVISSFTLSVKSTFTRVQRTCCVMSAIMIYFLGSAMWFGVFRTSAGMDIANISVYKEIAIKTVYQVIIATCVTTLIAAFYRYSRMRTEASHQYITTAPITIMKKRILPFFFVYIGHALVVIVTAGSVFLCILYATQWGSQVANIWLITTMIAWTMSELVVNPLRLIIAVIVLTVCRSRDVFVNYYKTLLRRRHIFNNELEHYFSLRTISSESI